MGRAAAKTGIMPTALVAVEQSFPRSQRVREDGLSVRMLALGPRLFAHILKVRPIRDWFIGLAEKSDPGMWGGLLCRKRYLDDKVTAFRDEVDARRCAVTRKGCSVDGGVSVDGGDSWV